MKKTILLYLSILLVFACAKTGFCGTLEKEGKAFVIQDKIFHRYHELGFALGYIPDDDFYEAFPVGINYTFNFNDRLAWEVVRGQIVVNTDKDLKGDLEDDYGVTPQAFDEPKYLIHTHFVYKPSYGKDAVLNRSIINHESYLFLGCGMASYETHNNYGESETKDAFSLSFGIGKKYFLNKKFCLNFEIRDMINFKDDETVNNIWFGVSIGYRFNLGERKTVDDTTIDTLKRYLEENDENE